MTATLITLKNPRSEAAEAYRTLRTNLMFSRSDKPLHTLLVTSASGKAGKSTALANLAVTFAQAGSRTILVDADLHEPAQSKLWNVNAKAGLTTMMNDDPSLANPPLVETGVEYLSLLPAGDLPEVPADLLISQRMNEIIGVLKARADFVLFDCAPVLSASDAALLGSKLDGVLLAVKAGSTRRDHVVEAKQALEQVNVNLIGSMLINAPRR